MAYRAQRVCLLILTLVGKFHGRGWENLEKNGELKIAALVLWVPIEVARLMFGMDLFRSYVGWPIFLMVPLFFMDYMIGLIGNSEWKTGRPYRAFFFSLRFYLAWVYLYYLPPVLDLKSFLNAYAFILQTHLLADGLVFYFNHLFQNKIVQVPFTPDPARDSILTDGVLHRVDKMVIHLADDWMDQEIDALETALKSKEVRIPAKKHDKVPPGSPEANPR